MRNRFHACVRLLSLVALALVACATVSAAEPDEQTRAAILALRDGLVESLNRGEIAKLVTYGTDDVVVTFQNGDVCRGPAEVRAFFGRMTKGPSGLIAEYSTVVTVDGMNAESDGRTVVAFGSSRDHLKLSSGTELNLNGRWTATAVNVDGQWKLASIHTSDSIFDNPVLERMKTTTYLMTFFGFLMGVTVGLIILVANSIRRKKAETAGAPD